MNSSRIILISVLSSVILSLSGSWLCIRFNNDKIGYIKTGVVIKEYKGMIAATEQYNNELKVVQANLDTLHNRYETLKAQNNSLRANKKEEGSYKLEMAKTEFDKYNEQASVQMQARREELTRKVLEKINDFITGYGKENNYKLILGTTEDGSILYGKEGDDLTQTVLNILNENYSGKENTNKAEQ